MGSAGMDNERSSLHGTCLTRWLVLVRRMVVCRRMDCIFFDTIFLMI